MNWNLKLARWLVGSRPRGLRLHLALLLMGGIQGGTHVFEPSANAFRFYEDGTEDGSTPIAAQDTDITRVVSSDSKVHLRYRIDETGQGNGNGAATDDYALEYNKNGAGWVAVTASSTNVRADTGSSLTDGAATTNRATNGISDPGGSFVAGEQEEGNGVVEDHALTANDFTEHVWALLLVSADLAHNDTLDFRVTYNGGAPGMPNNVTPTITVSMAQTATPSPLVAALALAAVTLVAGGVTLTPAPLVVTISLPDPAVASVVTVTPDPLLATVSLPDPQVVTAFPKVVTTNQGGTPDGTNHTINLPAGIEDGDLVIVEIHLSNGGTITWPGGWTEFINVINALHAAFRHADGTEGGSIAITTSASTETSYIARRINNHDSAQDPQAGTGEVGNDANPDPPNLVPTWGNRNTLWFAVTGYTLATAPSAYPASYTNGLHEAGLRSIASAQRELTAASEDPGTFTITSAVSWRAQTYAVAGIGGAPVTVTPAPLVANVSLPDPAVSSAITVIPSPLLVTDSLPSVSLLIGGVTLSPDPLVSSFSLPAVGVTSGATVSPAPLVLTLSAPDPELLIGGVALSPDPLLATLALPDPIVTQSGAPQTVTPSALLVSLGLPDPALIAGGVSLTPNPLVSTLSLPDVVASAGQVVSPNALVFTFSLPNPLLIPGVVTATPAPLVSSLALPSVSLLPGGVSTLPDALLVALSLPEVSASSGFPGLVTGTITISGRLEGEPLVGNLDTLRLKGKT